MSEQGKHGEKSQDLFSTFMKKQISENSKKKAAEIKAPVKKKPEKSKPGSKDQKKKRCFERRGND